MRIIKGLLHTFTQGLSAKKKAGLCGLRSLPDPRSPGDAAMGHSGLSISLWSLIQNDLLSISDVWMTLTLGKRSRSQARLPANVWIIWLLSVPPSPPPDSWESCASAGAGGHTCAQADMWAKHGPFVRPGRIFANKIVKSVGFKVFLRR